MGSSDNDQAAASEEDTKPLVSGGGGGDNAKGTKKPAGFELSDKQKKSLPAVIAGVVIFIFLFSLKSSDSTEYFGYQATHHVTPDELAVRLQEAKNLLFSKLQVDYGEETFESVFLSGAGNANETRGRTAFLSPSATGDNPGVSWERIKRKMKLKLLQVLTDPQHAGDSLERESNVTSNVTFIWATGGHSAAASHGNFFNQSYTYYLELVARPVFAALGIDMRGRNYAVGGQNSAPEIAWCSQEIFGLDIDVLSWDYGMTDTRQWSQFQMYFWRAALGPSRPAAVLMPQTKIGDRREALQELEDRGMTTLYLQDEQIKRMEGAMPDTAGISTEEIDALPPFVRAYKCRDRIEDGEPFCKVEKFMDHVCPHRKFKTSWHPGWKWHALHGNLMALMLVEVLEDAIKDLQKLAAAEKEEDGLPFDPQVVLEQLLKEEEADATKLRTSDLPPRVKQEIRLAGKQVEDDDDLLDMFYKHPSYCHTALVPAEIRYQGILQELNRSVSIPEIETGMKLHNSNVQSTPNPGDSLRLVAENSERQQCEVQLNIDHRDYFYIDTKEEWKQLVLPNPREQQVYATTETPIKGIISVCYVSCPWNQCPAGNIVGGIADNQVSMEINGQKVTGLTNFGILNNELVCHLLQSGGEGQHTFKPNDQGQFVIRVKVNAPQSYLRFSSFVIF